MTGRTPRRIALLTASATLLVALATSAGATVTIAGDGIVLESGSSAYASAAVSSNQFANESNYDPVASATFPSVPLSVSSSTSAFDTFDDQTAASAAANTTTLTFVTAASGTLRSLGSSTASASGDDGYAYGSNYYYLQYSFVPDTTATITITYDLAGPDLACCGNRIQVQDLSTGSFAQDYGLF